MNTPRRSQIFLSSLFFVLGFSSVFSLLGVLLQTVLLQSSYGVQTWLGRIGGVIIIFFGLYTVKLVRIPFLEQKHAVSVKRTFNSAILTSFVFGAAFAVGWTPCVSAALGAILALATSQAGSAFLLLFAYTLGIGIPFLLVGLFTSQAERFIQRLGVWLDVFQYIFGGLLILLGVLIFTRELSRIANLQFLTQVLTFFQIGTSAGGTITSFSITNMAIAIFAGFASFLSPCILPIIPGFLSYLATTATKQESQTA